MSGTALAFVAIAALIAANAVFVAGEFALVAADRHRIDEMARAGHRRARIVHGMLGRLTYELSGAQLGITVTSLVLGLLAEPTIGRLIEPVIGSGGPLGHAVATALTIVGSLLIATVTQMVLGELVPKNAAIARPLGVVLMVGPLLRAFTLATKPLLAVLDGSATWTVRRLGVEPRNDLDPVHTLDEMERVIEHSGEHGTIEADEQELLVRTIRFGDKTADDVLVPRTAITSLSRDDTLVELAEQARRTGFSRFPVTGEGLDDIVGVVHVKSALGVPAADRAGVRLGSVMSDPAVIPESLPLDELLVRLRGGGRQMAVVIDEYGGTAGLVTLEDLLEELVGEIRDEYDPIEAPARRFTYPWQSGTWVLEGSLHRDEVREVCGLELPEGQFETLAGWLLVLFDRIPAAGDRTTADDWSFEVLEMDRLRIALVRVTGPPPPSSTSAPVPR